MHISKFINQNEKNLGDFFNNLENIFYEKNLLLGSGRNTLKKIKFNERVFVIKSFKIPNIFQAIIYANIRKSKAERSYLNSMKLISAGLHSPKPIGYSVYRNKLKIFQSYYISEYHNYEHDFRFLVNDFNSNIKIVEGFIKVIIKMHDSNIYHHDLTPGNILISPKSKNFFSFVDNNRMSFKKMNLKMRMESISKLTNNIDQLNIFAELYAKNSLYHHDECIKYIQRGNRRRRGYIEAKKILRGR